MNVFMSAAVAWLAASETNTGLSGLLSDLATIVTQCFTWLGSAASQVTSNPLLLLTVGFMAAGFAFGLLRRALASS